MASPPRDPVSVSETGAYSNQSDGPKQDTDAFSRGNRDHQPDRPGHIDAPSARTTGSHGVLPDLRSSVRSVEEVERNRPREMPRWAPIAIAILAFIAIVGVGSLAVLQITKRPPRPANQPEQPKLEEMNGVPVRDDLNAPGL